jgi:hypothetical protein
MAVYRMAMIGDHSLPFDHEGGHENLSTIIDPLETRTWVSLGIEAAS